MREQKTGFWTSPLAASLIKSEEVRMPEMLFGYFIGPFGALLASGIYTSILQNYFTDVLKLDLNFLTALQLFSTILIVAANLIVGQLIERTHCLAGKARPWVLLSALTMSVASVLMFIVPFTGVARMVWIAIAYNLFYAVAYPIYNTANSTLIPVSTRNSQQRSALASFTNVAGLGVMGVGSMIFPMLVSFALKEDQHRWFLAMLAVAVFTALTILLQYKFTRERVTEEQIRAGRNRVDRPAAAPLSDQLRAVASEKWWWIVMVFYLSFQWAGAMKNGSMAYFCKWVMDNTFFGCLGGVPVSACHPGGHSHGGGCLVCGTAVQQVLQAAGLHDWYAAGHGGRRHRRFGQWSDRACCGGRGTQVLRICPGLLPDSGYAGRCHRPHRVPPGHPYRWADHEYLQLHHGGWYSYLQCNLFWHAQRCRV